LWLLGSIHKPYNILFGCKRGIRFKKRLIFVLNQYKLFDWFSFFCECLLVCWGRQMRKYNGGVHNSRWLKIFKRESGMLNSYRTAYNTKIKHLIFETRLHIMFKKIVTIFVNNTSYTKSKFFCQQLFLFVKYFLYDCRYIK